MIAFRTWVLPALALAVAACGGEGEGGAEGAGDTTTAAVSPAPAPSATTPPTTPAESTMTGQSSATTPVQLTALNNSGVTGQAQIMEHGAAETMVTVTLQGQGSGTHPGHIHSGTCDQLGPVVAPLQSVAMASGTGTSTSTVKVSMGTVMNGQHVVNFHAGAGANPMAPVACGAIPAHGSGGHGA
ncbi:MAG TPA: multicopper oxidase domain-containing protein [Longimicrobium sp.]|jgi:hypothetical protein